LITLLYFDDEPDLLELGKLFLEQDSQFIVDTAVSPQEGLALLASKQYDAVISDYQMPGMDGIALLKEIRTKSAIPFILFTGRGREEVAIEAINNGATFYMQKGGDPAVQFAELAHKIRQAVQKRRAEIMIRDHERREADIINFLPDATLAIDIHGTVIAWNRAMEEMTGVPAAEMIGKAGYEYALPFYHERRPVTIDLILHDDPSIAGKYPVMNKVGNSLFSEIYIPHLNNGRGAHLWFTASPLYDTAGNLTGAIESVRDITGRKRTEEALNLENQRIESLLSLTRMDTRPDAETTEKVVEDAIRLTGSTIGYLATLNDDESVMTMQHWSRSAHESCNIINKPLVYAVEKTGLWGEAVRQRKPVITNDYAANNPLKRGTPRGHVSLVRHMNIPVFDGDHIVAIAGVGNKDTDYDEGDIHQLQLLMQGWWQILVRKRAQEDIRRSNAILKTQQETSPEGIVTVDEQKNILNYNQRFVAIWDLPADLLASRDHEAVLRHIAGRVVDPAAFLARISSLYDHTAEKSCEDLLLKDGRILEWFSAPMLGEKEEYFGRVWFFRDITRRRMDEDAVRAAQEKFSTIYLQSPDVIWISELESGRFIDVNDAAVRIFGHTREEFMGRTSFNLGIWVNKEDRAVLIEGIRKEGRVDRSEILLRRKNGEQFPAECSASTIHVRGTEYLIITIRDISGIRHAEDSARKSFAILKGVIESLNNVVIFALDRQYRYTAFNENHRRTMKRIWGVDIAVGNSMPGYIRIPEDRKKAVANFDRALAGESFSVTEACGDTAFERRWYENTYNPVTDENGDVTGLTLFLTDITERKRAEEALKESEHKFREIFDNINDGIELHAMTKDGLPGKFLEVNDVTCRMLGYTREELLQKSLFDFSMEYISRPIGEIGREIISGGHSRFETVHRNRKGELIPVEINAHVIRHEDTTMVLSVVRDITGRRRVEDALREANKKLNLLSGVTRHDINNQLLAAHGFLKVLHQKIPDPAYENYFTRIEDAWGRISGMIQFTREYEQIGVHTPVWQDCRILAETAVKDIPPGKVLLKNDLPANAELYADPLIARVFYNLADNAVRHGETISTLHFFLRISAGSCCIICEDDGVGVPVEEKDRIFDRGVGKNTGMGLYLAREILSITNITITETGMPGKGARFEINVPKGMFRAAGTSP
jgi:PAS domain S-box-containing protein